ncbi:hypothetical protein [Sorangium sp. So ce854]|uniref:hypothetical protein n=1 Tax=Sorangium sp. So ce854 TaxID=3133322 RepID=UPI003F640F79
MRQRELTPLPRSPSRQKGAPPPPTALRGGRGKSATSEPVSGALVLAARAAGAAALAAGAATLATGAATLAAGAATLAAGAATLAAGAATLAAGAATLAAAPARAAGRAARRRGGRSRRGRVIGVITASRADHHGCAKQQRARKDALRSLHSWFSPLGCSPPKNGSVRPAPTTAPHPRAGQSRQKCTKTCAGEPHHALARNGSVSTS